MPTTVRIVCGPAGSGRTRRLLGRYRQVAGAAPGAALWLAPARRQVDALRPRLLNGVTGILAPNLFTFQQFVEEIIRVNDPAARPLSQVQRRLLIEEVVADLHASGQLSHFIAVVDTRGFAETVFDLIAGLKQNEIWAVKFEEAVAAMAADPDEHTANLVKARQCALLYSAYQRLLVQHHLYDQEGRFWYARDLLGRGERRPFADVRAVFVDGFTDFTHTEHEILAALGQWVDELWITLPDEPGEDRAELFRRPRLARDLLQPLGPEVETLTFGSGTFATCPTPASRPPGLAHLDRQLFRPLRRVVRADNAAGVSCIEAPGTVGEVRMVARRIKGLLLEGVSPEDFLVTLRDVLPYADLIYEVFAEYGIAVDIEGIEPLLRNPAVVALLGTLRLPEEDWPFGPVTAVLRSGYFAPDWPETGADPDVAQHAEALLRLLGESRSSTAYLNAVARWAEKVQPGLEDEQAEETRRQRTHALAKKCQAFLMRFFRAWDDAPARAPLHDHAAWLRRLADDLGITRAAATEPRDAAALHRLWSELEQWRVLEQRLHDRPRKLDRMQFQRTLTALCAEAGLARTPRGPGRVRVLSAGLARHLAMPYVFIMGLGERSFPRLAAPVPLFDEPERRAFQQAGVAFPSAADVLPDEMLLFYQVLTRAQRGLVLSYPAVDEKGQALLPSSFYSSVLDCFTPDAVPVQRRRMLIEGYDRDPPRSVAEYRVQLCASLAESAQRRAQSAERAAESAEDWATNPVRSALRAPRSALPIDLAANLAAAAHLAHQRFDCPDHSPFDGLFRDPAVIAEVSKRFGPEHVFSPTALESYVACPFRFLMGNVLHLEPLEEPREEIENTDRGLTFHRALARLHTFLHRQGIDLPNEAVDGHIRERLDEAIEEAARRAPSPASEALWRLEGKRLQRAAQRYRPHWAKFVEPWLSRGVKPRPSYFEIGFGLPVAEDETPYPPLVIRVDGIEVRISGRIDRVDVTELPEASGGGCGFWIIDYKTGRSSHYTGTDLHQLRRLQLTLYALAVEEVLLAGQRARPLGLAYWLVTDSGPKIALPPHPRYFAWLDETITWRSIREQLQHWVARLAANIRQGVFPLKPRSTDCTQTCDFGQVCRISQCRDVVEKKTWQLPLPVID
jgi:ATP-dependent helicase/DNAse subunit B